MLKFRLMYSQWRLSHSRQDCAIPERKEHTIESPSFAIAELEADRFLRRGWLDFAGVVYKRHRISLVEILVPTTSAPILPGFVPPECYVN